MASYIEINDLGSFASINALWAAYPEGGQEGDYCTIDGVKYRWDKYDRMWVADPNFGPTPARSVTTFDGDVNMQNNLTVAGYIRAKGIKQPCLGLFLTEAALEAKWPDPEVGMWAIVGDESPFIVYRCDEDGEWTNTEEETTGFDDVDLSSIIINGVKGWVPISSTSDLPLEPSEAERERGYLLGTTLYVYVGTGGDTLDGKYLSAQLKGADGESGADGQPGAEGKSAYQCYYDTTSDNPKKTEEEWLASLKGADGVSLGDVEIADNCTTNDATKVLSAKQGYELKGMIDKIGSKVDTKLEWFKTPTVTPDSYQSIIVTAPLDIQQNFGVGKMVTTSNYATLSSFHVVCALPSNKSSLLPIPSGNKYVFTSFVIRTKGTIGAITASDFSYNSNNAVISGGITQRVTSYEPYDGFEDTYKVYVRYTLSNTAQSQDIKLYQDVTMRLTNLTAEYSGFQSFYFRVWWGNEPDIVWDWNVPFWHDKKVNTIDVTRLNTNNYTSASGDVLYTVLGIAPQDIQDTFKVRNVCTLNNSAMPTTSTDIKILPCTSQYATGGGKFTLPSWAKYVYASFYIRTKHTLSNVVPNLTHYTTTGTLKTDVVELTTVKVENEPLYEDISKVTVKWKIAATVDYNLVFFPYVSARLSSVDTTNYNGFQSFYFRLWYSAADEYDFEWDNAIDLNRSYLTNNPFTQTFRKICLYGTSIEATNYFDSVAVAFGLKKGETYLNFGNGGGGITWNPSNASFSDTHVKKAFSCTLAEKQEELTSRGIDPATVPAADLNTSYDVSVLQNLDADLYIFGTYGINDRSIEGWDAEQSEFDRTTIFGAYNYVIDKLLTAKPNAKIIILGQHCFAWANTNKVNEIQSDVAKHWNIPFLDMGHNLMFNTRTYSLYTSDGCHPNNAGAAVIAEFVKDWLISHTNNRTK